MIIKSHKDLSEYYDLLSTVYHEAGHVVFGMLNNINIQSACVFMDKKIKRIAGYTYYNCIDYKQFSDRKLYDYFLKIEICFIYSGLAAEKYHFKNICGSDKFPMFLRGGSSDDTLSASELINQENMAEPGVKRYHFKQKMIKESTRSIVDNWDAVTVIAHALFKNKKIDTEQIKKLLVTKTNNKKFWKEKFKETSVIYSEVSADEVKLKTFLQL